MSKKIFYQIFRATLVGMTLLTLLALAPGGIHNAKAQDGPEMPPNDVRVLPETVRSRQTAVERSLALAPTPSYVPGYYDTSVYMLGDVAVGIILPESTGNSENWTTAEQNEVVNEIQDGLNWWKTTGGDLANLTFQYDIQFGVPTSYEPISRPSSDDALWISEVMSNLGYTTGDYWSKVYAYENDLRNQYQTDWAFTIFVVDSSADIDGKFTDSYFAYAYIGGPFMVMTYDNNGWGIEDMDKITAHETGHIFWAGDQYGSCSTATRYGYLGIVNGNCNGNPSIMKDNSLVVDSFAKGQIGWQDSDSDNIPDVLDTAPVVTLASYEPNPTPNGILSYSGYVKSPVYPHAVCGTGDWCYTKDITTQSIDTVNYQIDGGEWNQAIAQDGAFNSDVEEFSFFTNSLSPGTHSIKLTSENSSGNVSATWSDSVTIKAPAQAPGTGKYDDTNPGWTYTGSWATWTGTGPYNNTFHYSTTVDTSFATFTFEGTLFKLFYSERNSRGEMDIFVDDNFVATINANNPVAAWQKAWLPPSTLDPGTHAVKVVHKSGNLIDIDAIEINPVPPPGTGKYDDANSGWKYTGSWSTWTGTGPYNNTFHYSGVVDSFATFDFEGTRFRLIYAERSSRGEMDIFVDDNFVTTINANNPVATWQKTWTLPSDLSAGYHTVKVLHKSGNIIDIDAIEIFTPEFVPPSAINNLVAKTGTADGQVLLTWNAPGDDGTSGTASTYLVRYADNEILTEADWGNATSVTSGLPTPQPYNSPESMTVSDLLPGHTYFFAVRAQDESLNLGDLSNSPSAMAYIKAPPGTGKYDDTHAGWTYTGTWGTYTGPGPYNNTFHYSSVVGSFATFTFDGTMFNLIYSERSSRGEMDIFVDNKFVATINANNSVATWQKTWAYPSALGAGYHTVKVVHKSGSYIDIDAIEISGTLDSTPPAAIDDLQAVTGSSMGSVDLSWTAVGDDGTIGIATNYLVRYRTDTAITSANWDDTATKFVTTGIPTPQTSGQPESMTVFGLDTSKTYYFAVRARDEVLNMGEVSTCPITCSAQPFSPPPPPNDNIDYATTNPIYSMPYTDTQDYFYAATTATTEPLDPQIVQCNSNEGKYSIWYAFTPKSNGMLFADTYGTNLAYDTVLAVWAFDGSTFTHVACNDNANENTFLSQAVAYLNKDTTYYIEVVQYSQPPVSSPSALNKLSAPPIDEIVLNANFSPAPLKHTGMYDDTDNGWVYSGNWATWTGTGPYNNTFHYSNVVGSFTTFAFSGTMFELIYSERSSRGEMDIFVDNNFVATINANNPIATWQKPWSLPSALAPGIHTVKVVHKSGSIIDIDAIVINPGAPPSNGKYDDTDPGWKYTGSWATWIGTGPYNNTFHYSSTVDISYATFDFEGPLFELTYSERSSRGEMDIFVDNNFVATINANNPIATWQKTWRPPSPLGPGLHTLKVVHKSGNLIDIDAIEIINPPGIGKYDDTYSGWKYTGSWATWTGTGPYNDTFHYSSVVGSFATFDFEGTLFRLIYSERSSRGEMDIFVDGGFVATINANNPIATWQKSWSLPSALAPGIHTVKVMHKSGTLIDIDAIEIITPP